MSDTIPASEFQDFVYRVSHDFSAPLRAIVEFSKLLREEHSGQLDKEGLLYLDMIQQGGEKMRSMMDGLLAFSRIASIPPCPERLDLKDIIRRCPLPSGKAEVLIGNLPDITADPAHIEKLFSILLDNAVKYTAPSAKPRIEIKAEQRDGETVFVVADNGMGIDPQYHEDVFIIFRRLHAESAYPGLGMGLALARRIVAVYDGRIWVESSAGQGARFYFTLPKALK